MCDLYTRYLQEIIYLKKKKNEKSQTRKIYYTIQRFILFHLSRENFPTLEFLSFFFFSYFVISLEKNFFITDHVKT